VDLSIIIVTANFMALLSIRLGVFYLYVNLEDINLPMVNSVNMIAGENVRDQYIWGHLGYASKISVKNY